MCFILHIWSVFVVNVADSLFNNILIITYFKGLYNLNLNIITIDLNENKQNHYSMKIMNILLIIKGMMI